MISLGVWLGSDRDGRLGTDLGFHIGGLRHVPQAAAGGGHLGDPGRSLDTVPAAACRSFREISSSKKRACSPYSWWYTDAPPCPVPVGSPVWISEPGCTLWKSEKL